MKPNPDTIQPIGYRLLVTHKLEEITPGGIHIPQTVEHKENQRAVVQVLKLGTNTIDDKGEQREWEVAVGDKILADHFGHLVCEEQGLFIIHHRNVLCIL